MTNPKETDELISHGKPHFELMLTGDGSRSPNLNSPQLQSHPHFHDGLCRRCFIRIRSIVETCVPALLLIVVLALILFMIIAGKVIHE